MNAIEVIILINKTWNCFTSFLMKLFLRLNGGKIGKNTFISLSSKIVGVKIIIGNDCIIKKNVNIKANEIQIGNACIISEGDYITGTANFIIGDKTFIGKKVRINLSRDVTIGYDVGIGENSAIWTHGYFPPADEGYPIVYEPVVIKDCAWVSTNIIILPGVTIGKRVIIAAGSVVTKSVPDGVIVAGNPAKVIKKTIDIKNNKGFLDIIEDIIDKYRSKELIEKIKKHNSIIYKFPNCSIYIIEKELTFDIEQIPKRISIIFYKGARKELESKLKNFYWFNFDNKTQKRSKDKEVLKITNFLRGFGIRFLKE